MPHKKEDVVQVLYVVTKLELGGAQKVCLALLDGVLKHGIITTLVSGAEGVLASAVENRSDVYLLKSFKRELGFFGLWAEPYTFFLMVKQMRLLKKQSPKLVVHTHSTKAGIMGRWAAFFAGIKVRVHTVHGFGFHEHQSWVSWIFVYFLEWITSFVTTHFVCVSKKDMDLGSRMLPTFARKCSLIRAAVDWDRFYLAAGKDQGNRVADDFIIGAVACFKPQKNIFDLLKAFYAMQSKLSKIEKTNVYLQIIGDGVLRPEIEAWIREHHMQDRIQLLGWQADVASWMKTWRVFALSSLWEGLPCAVVEARLSKIPVVAYDVGGIFEVIKDGGNGFLIPPTNWQLFASRLEQLVNDQALYKQLCLYEDALDEFSIPSMVEKHAKLYRTLLNV